MEKIPEFWSESPLTLSDQTGKPRRPVERRSAVFRVLVGVVSVAAFAAGFWLYGDIQRNLARLSSDIAQIRLSLELFNRQQAVSSDIDHAALQDLSNRLALLEESWRTVPVANALTAVPPDVSGSISAAAVNAVTSEVDCLPTGTRFLVAAGDSYPVCDVPTAIAVGVVDNGFITLADDTVIAAGGNIALPGSGCMIGVVSAGENGMSDYAEIRVTC